MHVYMKRVNRIYWGYGETKRFISRKERAV